MKTIRINDRIWNELSHDGIADTSTYRYCVFCDSFDGHAVLKRIRREYLDTTAALSDASDSNPNGWEVLRPDCVRLTK